MPSSHLILCRPLLLLPPIPPSISVFSNKSTLHMRWPKYWSFSFNISPTNEHSGLISFRMDWLDLFAVQGTLRVFSSTTVQKHQFFSAQLSLYSKSRIHTCLLEKTIALTRQTFVGKVMSLLLNMLSGFDIACLPRSKLLLISWQQSPFAVALVVKNPPANSGDIRHASSVPELGRSPGEGNGNPLQYSCLENSMDRGAWQAKVHRLSKSRM